jgi:hypothetical protein
MFALLAALLCALSAFGVHPDSVDLFQLGIASLALHFAWDYFPAVPSRRP